MGDIRNLRIGTRGSPLALMQTELVVSALEKAAEGILSVEVVKLKTLGDRKQGTAEAGHGDKKDWIYELELAVLDGSVDLALHSGKDVPSDFEKGTSLLPVLRRANPCDAFIGRLNPQTGKRLTFDELPTAVKVGTASLRRRAQMLRLRPDLTVIEHRGNVATRIKKMEASDDIYGIVLACAGLERLGETIERDTFAPDRLTPAINQGTLVAQFKSGREDLNTLLDKIVDSDTLTAWTAERACVSVLDADCKSAVSIYAVVDNREIDLIGRVLTPDGAKCIEEKRRGTLVSAHQLGLEVGKALLAGGADELLEESRQFEISRSG